MITAKFGGTAITPRNLVYLKKILTTSHKVVVVSAIGKSHPNDIKTTDLLATYFRTHNQDVWQTICSRYRNLVDVNCVNIDIEQLLYDAHARALKFDLDYCLSLGEELSAKVVAKFLGATYVEAQDVICFGKRTLNLRKTLSCLKQVFQGSDLAVIGGFYGGQLNTRKTFSRGGSDVTASLCALATNSTLCENWTDANGVCQGNPTEILGVQTLGYLGYDQMYTLAQAGATVLHPDAVKPLQTKGIPLVIGNFYNSNAPQTLISNAPNMQKLLCVTYKQMDGKFVVTVVHNMSQMEVFQRLSTLVECLKTHHVPRKNLNFVQFSSSNSNRKVDNGLQFCTANAPLQTVTCKQNVVTIECKTNILQQIFDTFNCNLQ